MSQDCATVLQPGDSVRHLLKKKRKRKKKERNLTKERETFYTENCKLLIKKNYDTNKWKSILHLLKDLMLLKYSDYLIYRFNAILIKIPIVVFAKLEQKI